MATPTLAYPPRSAHEQGNPSVPTDTVMKVEPGAYGPRSVASIFLASSWWYLPRYRLILRVDFEASPHIVAAQGAEWVPATTVPTDGRLGGKRPVPVHPLNPLSDPEVPGRKHIGPSHVEQEIHLRRPSPDAMDPGQLFDDFLVREGAKVAKVQLPAIDTVGEVPKIGRLLWRQSGGAQGLQRRIKEPRCLGKGPPTSRGAHPAVDRGSGGARDLLEDDGPGEGSEPPWASLDLARSDPTYPCTQRGILRSEVMKCRCNAR